MRQALQLAALTPQFRGNWLVVGAAFCCLAISATRPARGDAPKPLMDGPTMRRITEQYLRSKPPRKFPDLVVYEDLEPLLDEVERRGWEMPYREQLKAQMLGQGEFLAKFAETESGANWLKKVSGQSLIYDRVDRISHVAHGQEMLQRVAKLPNGEKYGQATARNFTPSLADLLPLKGGKKQKIKDYDKPTGKAYTMSKVLELVAKTHESAEDTRKQLEGNPTTR
ncbi:MAG: hypothetical protein KDB14_24800 [Planctomycetales bacterium]|nr:hypothetical protein [Planctomycetales bacterium]